jgi:hypothetical protein
LIQQNGTEKEWWEDSCPISGIMNRHQQNLTYMERKGRAGNGTPRKTYE